MSTCFNRTGMILFSYLTDFNYFPLIFFFLESCWTQSEQVKNDRFERGCDVKTHFQVASSTSRFDPKIKCL